MKKFEYKGKPYHIIGREKIKIGDEWKDTIRYECLYDNPDGKIWNRFKDDFFRLFKMIQPKNLNEVVDLLLEDVAEQNAVSEVAKYGIPHHGAGTSIRNSLHLWWSEELRDRVSENPDLDYPQEKPALVAWFNERDIYHADDMSGIISEAVKAKLNGIEYDINPTIERYKKHWENQGFKDGICKKENRLK
jgi:hypothetical protein